MFFTTAAYSIVIYVVDHLDKLHLWATMAHAGHGINNKSRLVSMIDER